MRVIAIESLTDGELHQYGEGEYLGELIAEGTEDADFNIRHPCIKLDNGQYIWGFQCWWCELEKWNTKRAANVKTKKTVPVIKEFKPREE